ncbi:murein hydrolase activator EnvC family protein, partial [Roseococcus sp. DSY-14]|uniref:murein hydrolase activator EnvC family protein n=1 Tax=Roseococcus sp. DSY-14 TaxID=3369650 RepID=UPI00387B194F
AAAGALDRQIAEARGEAERRSAAEREALLRAEMQVARARTLEEALARIEAERNRQEARGRLEAARRPAAPRPEPRPEPRPAPEPPAQPGAWPVAGTLLRGWGQAGEGGPSRGLSIAAPPGARVTAPCAGPVAFAGPFRSYGRMVILDCGGGQHWVLAGLDRLDVGMGARLGAGEPLGVMAREGRPVLYVELRRRGEAADPRPWLRPS